MWKQGGKFRHLRVLPLQGLEFASQHGTRYTPCMWKLTQTMGLLGTIYGEYGNVVDMLCVCGGNHVSCILFLRCRFLGKVKAVSSILNANTTTLS